MQMCMNMSKTLLSTKNVQNGKKARSSLIVDELYTYASTAYAKIG